MYPDASSPGYGVFVKNMVEGLDNYGIHVECSALKAGRYTNKLLKIVKYIKFYILICIGFFKKYDAIYIHFPNHSLPVLLPLLAIKKQRVIANLHGEDLLYSGSLGTVLGKLNYRFLRKVEKIIVPSTYFKEEVLKRIGCKEDKIFVSPSGGIDNNLFYPINNQSVKDKVCLGFVGRIDEGKGIKEFVEAIYLLNQQINCEAIVIGYGPYENELSKLLEKLLLTEKVKVIKGVKQDKLCEYYNIFDLFLFLSNRKTESLGLVGIEAMACGTPVIGTNIGGIPSYLIDGFNGFLLPNRDVHSVVNAVLKFQAMSDDEKEIMCENSLKTSQKYFKDTVSKELAQVFLKLKEI